MDASVRYVPVASRDEATRSDFVIKVYQHLILAVLAFVAIEAVFLNTGVAEGIYNFLVESAGPSWLLILGGVMLVQWLATNAAHDVLNVQKQYLGLFAMAAAEAVIFAPFLYYFFQAREDGGTVWAAAVITGLGFAGLSAVAYTTRSDLSGLGPFIKWGFICALLLIVGAVVFGFQLGVWFSVAMIALAGGAILYQTQTIMRQYPAEAYVGGAVALFASLMTMFWYVLRLLGQIRN